MMYVITDLDKKRIDFHENQIIKICRCRKKIIKKIEDLECIKDISNGYMEKVYDDEIKKENRHLKRLDIIIIDELEAIDRLWNGWYMEETLLKRQG